MKREVMADGRVFREYKGMNLVDEEGKKYCGCHNCKNALCWGGWTGCRFSGRVMHVCLENDDLFWENDKGGTHVELLEKELEHLGFEITKRPAKDPTSIPDVANNYPLQKEQEGKCEHLKVIVAIGMDWESKDTAKITFLYKDGTVEL